MRKKKANQKNESDIPLEIIGDSVFEASRWINLPLDEFFLEPIAGNLTENLKAGSEIKINESKNEIDENGKRGTKLRKLGLPCEKQLKNQS